MKPGSSLRRFTLLHALRWLPTGLAAPVLVLLPHDRGLELGGIGAAFALYNVVVVALELPTGGWADPGPSASSLSAITSQLALTNLAGATSIPTAWLVAGAIVLVAATTQARTATSAPPALHPISEAADDAT